jgi:hypothetical protein
MTNSPRTPPLLGVCPPPLTIPRFLFVMDAMFLLIEARRHSLYYFSQRRVTALERGFFAHVLLANAVCTPARGSSAPALRPVPSLDMNQRWDGVVQVVGSGGPGGPSPLGPGSVDGGDPSGMATIGMATATAGMATVTGGLFTLELEQWDAALKALMLAPPGTVHDIEGWGWGECRGIHPGSG